METQIINQDWDLLKQFLPEGWEEKAKSTGALRRQRKFKSAGDILRLMLIHLADGCSMRETIARAKQGGIISISDVALLKRLRNSSEWFRWMTCEMLSRRGLNIIPPDFVKSYRLKSIDASVVSEPGSTGTDWRLHYSLDLTNLTCDQFIISRQETGESFTNFKVNPGDLFLGDRAYGRLKGMKHVTDSHGHFLVRLKHKAFTMYDKDDNKFNLAKNVKSLRVGQIMEFELSAILDDKSKLFFRLIVVRKSEVEAEKSVKRAIKEQRRKQRKINSETIELHKYVVLATSLPKEVTSNQIAELYRVRWQVEIAFKRLKSLLGMGHLPKTDIRSCRAWLHGKLFVAQLAQLILDEGQSFSPWGYPLRKNSLLMA